MLYYPTWEDLPNIFTLATKHYLLLINCFHIHNPHKMHSFKSNIFKPTLPKLEFIQLPTFFMMDKFETTTFWYILQTTTTNNLRTLGKNFRLKISEPPTSHIWCTTELRVLTLPLILTNEMAGLSCKSCFRVKLKLRVFWEE